MTEGNLRIAGVGSLSADGRDKTILVDGDNGSGSNVDPEEVQAFKERFTRVEIRMEGTDQHIVIPLYYDLLANSGWAVPTFTHLCAGFENMKLQKLRDADMSLVISSMALRVSLLFSCLASSFLRCNLFLLTYLLLHVKPSSWRLNVIG